jgi:hypothetical protein
MVRQQQASRHKREGPHFQPPPNSSTPVWWRNPKARIRAINRPKMVCQLGLGVHAPSRGLGDVETDMMWSVCHNSHHEISTCFAPALGTASRAYLSYESLTGKHPPELQRGLAPRIISANRHYLVGTIRGECRHESPTTRGPPRVEAYVHYSSLLACGGGPAPQGSQTFPPDVNCGVLGA